MGGSRSTIASTAPWAGATALIVLAFLVRRFFTGAATTEESRTAPVSSTDDTFGAGDADLTVADDSDFLCPYCAEYAKWRTQLRQKHGDRVTFVYRLLPQSVT
jgi:hypothetical protein